MEQVQFQGAYGIIVTPFKPDGAVNFDELQKQIDKICSTSISGLVACGSTGECAQLSPHENKQIMTVAADTIDGRKPLICGATAGDYITSTDYLNHMAKCGAVGALVAPPYYFPLNDGEVLEFYRSIARNNSGVPIVSYHIPQFSSGISLSVYQNLLEIEEISGIKNSSGNFNLFMQQLDLRNKYRQNFSVLTGSDEALYGSLSVGCDGSFTAFAYVVPELVSYLYEHFGRDETSLACQMDLLCLLRFAGSYSFPVGYKAVGEARGYSFGPYRQPLSDETMTALTKGKEEIRYFIKNLFEKYNIIKEE